MNFSRIVFFREFNPLYEDLYSSYSSLRFYSTTISVLAENLGINEICIVYNDNSYHMASNSKHLQEEGNVIQKVCEDWLSNLEDNSNNLEYSNFVVSKFYRLCKRKNISLKIMSIHEYFDYIFDDNSLVIISFMTNGRNRLKILVESILKLVNKSKGWIYLSSDNEFTGSNYKIYNREQLLEYVYEFKISELFEKLLLIIMTESNYKGISILLRNIFGVPVFYLPMVLNLEDLRFTDFYNFDDKYNNIVLLKPFSQFKGDIYVNMFDSIRNFGVVYESGSLNIKLQEVRNFCKSYGLKHKCSKFWKIEEFEDILSHYRFFLGMSTPGSSRFTSKILEGTNANVYTILPKINFEDMGFDNSLYDYPRNILEKYNLGEVYTSDNCSVDVCDKRFGEVLNSLHEISKESFDKRINFQKNFIKEYFLEDSKCVKQCLNYIVDCLGNISNT